MDATVDLEMNDTTDAEVRDELIRECRERDGRDMRISRLATRFEACDVWDEEGFGSGIEWIRFNCHMTSNAAADLIAVGKNLERMPETDSAVSRGEIGFAHAKAMARTAAAIGTTFDEAPLLEKARENSPGKFYYICNHDRHAADRKGVEAEQTELVENRRLWVRSCENADCRGQGILGPERWSVP